MSWSNKLLKGFIAVELFTIVAVPIVLIVSAASATNEAMIPTAKEVLLQQPKNSAALIRLEDDTQHGLYEVLKNQLIEALKASRGFPVEYETTYTLNNHWRTILDWEFQEKGYQIQWLYIDEHSTTIEVKANDERLNESWAIAVIKITPKEVK